MKRAFPCYALLLSICLLTSACADMDVMLYGSQEAADVAKAENAAREIKRNSKKSQKLAAETLDLIRQERKKQRLYPTTGGSELREVANIRSQEIVINYSDTRPNDLPSFSLYEDYERLRTVRPLRELRAKGLKNPRDVVNYWLSRKDDKRILFGPRTVKMEIGLSIVGSTCYWVLVSHE